MNTNHTTNSYPAAVPAILRLEDSSPTPEDVKQHLKEVRDAKPEYDKKALINLGREIGLVRGFTLVELVAVIAILVTLVVVGVNVLAWLTK